MGGEVQGVKKVIAAFDFDGTIIKYDSLPLFIWYASKFAGFISGSLISLPYLSLFLLKLMPNFKAKERMFSAYFKGADIKEFNDFCEDFSGKINSWIRPEAISKLKWHKDEGHEIVIISASVENWIIPWANQNGIKTVLATKIEVKNDKITGKFLSKNCHGAEKLCRLLAHNSDRDNYTLYAYGDSNGDKELLEAADRKFYRTF